MVEDGASPRKRKAAGPLRGQPRLACAELRGPHVGGVIAGILLVWVGLAAQAELSARMLPCLTLTVPMETELRQFLPNLGGGLLFERHPNPFPDNLGKAVNVRQTGQQEVQYLRR